MYTMQEACKILNLTYGTLKFYCSKGLVPNVRRNKNNHRIFSEKNILWLKGLICLKECGMSIQEIKNYLLLCLEGEKTILERKNLLAEKRQELLRKSDAIIENIAFIDAKQQFYDDVLSGKIAYFSNLTE